MTIISVSSIHAKMELSKFQKLNKNVSPIYWLTESKKFYNKKKIDTLEFNWIHKNVVLHQKPHISIYNTGLIYSIVNSVVINIVDLR